MIQPFEPAHSAGAGARRAMIRVCRVVPAVPRIGLRVFGALMLCMALAGCRHKTLWVPPSSATAPVDLESLPEPANAPVIAEVAPPELIPVQPAEPPKRPARRKPTTPAPKDASGVPSQQGPVQVASSAEPAELAICSLSTGGDAAPQVQQQARDEIASLQKRIAALPRSVASQQKSQMKQVNNFLKQAQQALNSGDAEGALTLATKARVIMDDIEKK